MRHDRAERSDRNATGNYQRRCEICTQPFTFAECDGIVANFIRTYADELDWLQFDPERPFETLLPEE